MAKIKYQYNPDTLSYSEIKAKRSHQVRNIIVVIFGFLFTAFIGHFILDDIFDSPKEKMLIRENENLKLHLGDFDKQLSFLKERIHEVENRDNSIYRQLFEAAPISDDVRQAGFGGVNRYKSYKGYSNSDKIISIAKEIDKLSKRIVIQSKSLDDIVEMAAQKEEMLASIPAIQPVKNEQLTRMASGYGMRLHPILKIRKMHDGMDFTAKRGTPVYASGNGTVTFAKRAGSYGNLIKIDHGYNYETRYAHLSKFAVGKGKKVKRGDLIGYVGNTGRSTGPHLHYEVRRSGKPVNPIYYYYGDLSPEEFVAMQKVADQEGQSLD